MKAPVTFIKEFNTGESIGYNREYITDQNENVFPMIPAGGAHCDMLLSGRDEMVSKDETDLNAV